MNNKTFRFIAVMAFLLLIFGTYYYHGGLRGELGFEQRLAWLQVFFAALVMLIGIILGTLFRQLEGRTGRVMILREFSSVFSSASFWGAICVSPLVFFAIFSVSRDDPGAMSSYVLAFENGFFWESVYKKLLGTR
ncbi:MAG: hypothetical protein HXY43_25570 [Fischerella sp.]|jgi:hypothetical protein|uniref:hypothetical protein n=1 Tax=Fischerella sp. TaxID=1191 RepID=UPI0017A535BF|nr:hypothetical protein [Fischerella sp.]NWF62512.1 hypothetical protein [Fischerella sp.]